LGFSGCAGSLPLAIYSLATILVLVHDGLMKLVRKDLRKGVLDAVLPSIEKVNKPCVEVT
jgi:hypothetical protein